MKIKILLFLTIFSLSSFAQMKEFQLGEAIKHDEINQNFNYVNNYCLIKDYRERTTSTIGSHGGSLGTARTWNNRPHTIVKCSKDSFISFKPNSDNKILLLDEGKYLVEYKSNFNLQGIIKTRFYNISDDKSEVITSALDLSSQDASNSDYITSSEVDIVNIVGGQKEVALQYFYQKEGASTLGAYNLGWDGFFAENGLKDDNELSTNYSTIVIKKID